MAEFRLPWPPPALSPNARSHWAVLAKAKKRYRRACWASVLEQRAKLKSKGPWTVTLEFQPPPRFRTADDDNMVARMKAGLDGVCDALGINDRDLRLQPPVRGPGTPDGCVLVRIERIAP